MLAILIKLQFFSFVVHETCVYMYVLSVNETKERCRRKGVRNSLGDAAALGNGKTKTEVNKNQSHFRTNIHRIQCERNSIQIFSLAIERTPPFARRTYFILFSLKRVRHSSNLTKLYMHLSPLWSHYGLDRSRSSLDVSRVCNPIVRAN